MLSSVELENKFYNLEARSPEHGIVHVIENLHLFLNKVLGNESQTSSLFPIKYDSCSFFALNDGS